MNRFTCKIRRLVAHGTRVGIALLLVMALFITETAKPAYAFDAKDYSQVAVGTAAAAGVYYGSPSVIAGASITSVTGSAAAGTAVATCVASVVCGAAVVVGAIAVGGLVYWAFSSSDTDVIQARWTSTWQWSTYPTYDTSTCTFSWSATWPSNVPAPTHIYYITPPAQAGYSAVLNDRSKSGMVSGGTYTYTLAKVNNLCPSTTGFGLINYYSGMQYYPLRFGVDATTAKPSALYSPAVSTPTGTATIPPPDRYLVSTGTCVLPDGTTISATAWQSPNFKETDATYPPTRGPQCPPGTVLGTFTVTEYSVGSFYPAKVIFQSGTLTTAATDMTDPCSLINGSGCAITLQQYKAGTGWRDCALDAVDCTGITTTNYNVTPQTQTYRCVTTKPDGTVGTTLAMTSCLSLIPVQKPPGSVTTTTPPGTGTSTTDATNVGTLIVAPPVASAEDCAPSGWSLLNPFAYARSTGCLFVWAFVPNTSTLTDIAVQARQSLTSTGLGSIALSSYTMLTSFFGAYSTGACTASDEQNAGYELYDTWMGLPCQNPLGSTYTPVMVILSGVIVIWTLFRLWSIAVAAFSGTGQEE